MQSFVYGPVFSRRLGRSLGIDVIPHKTCSFDCVYCECGKTTHLTEKRLEYFPASEIIAQLDRVMATHPDPEYITFAGSGEPTLSLALGPVIRHIKANYPEYPVAVLTNGSLLWDKDVISDLRDADLIIPTLATVREDTFRHIHRPLPGYSVSDVIQGLIELRRSFSGKIWVELFLIPGLNTTDDEIAALKEALLRIRPDRVQLNTLDRRGTDACLRPVFPDEMERIRKSLENAGLKVDVINPE